MIDIDEAKQNMWASFPDVEVKVMYDNDKDGKFIVVVLRGGFDVSNPKSYMDNAVDAFVGNEMYNQFIEIYLDDYWVRVLTFNFNNIVFEKKTKKIYRYKITNNRKEEYKFESKKDMLEFIGKYDNPIFNIVEIYEEEQSND